MKLTSLTVTAALPPVPDWVPEAPRVLGAERW